MHLVIVAISAIVLALTMIVARGLEQFPVIELRRRARAGHDSSLYRLKAHGRQGEWLLVVIGSVSLIVLLKQFSGWPFWIVLAASLAVIIWPFTLSKGGYLWRLVNITSGWLAKALTHLPLSPSTTHRPSYTKLYEKDDLLELLQRQTRQPDSRISEAELKIAASALTFGDKKVRDAMVPLSKTKRVAETDDIGPHLLDELHKTKADSFMVVKDTGKSVKLQPTGILYLQDALAHSDGGVVRTAMKPIVEFIDEDLGLLPALEAFLARKQHVFVVQNNFEEIVGMLSLQNVLEQIFGSPAKPEPTPAKK